MVSTRNENLSIVCCMHKHSSTERPWIIYVKIRFIRGLSLLPSDKYEIRIDHMEIALCFSSKNDFIVNSLSRPFSRNIFKLRFSRIYFPRDMTRERERDNYSSNVTVANDIRIVRIDPIETNLEKTLGNNSMACKQSQRYDIAWLGHCPEKYGSYWPAITGHCWPSSIDRLHPPQKEKFTLLRAMLLLVISAFVGILCVVAIDPPRGW